MNKLIKSITQLNADYQLVLLAKGYKYEGTVVSNAIKVRGNQWLRDIDSTTNLN